MTFFYHNTKGKRIYLDDACHIGVEGDNLDTTFRIFVKPDDINSIDITASNGMTIEPITGNKVNIKQLD